MESISDLQVPSLPLIEKDDHVAATPDYFMEIDAEMGSLFEETIDERARAAPSTAGVSSALRAAGAGSVVTSRDEHFDNFERELEEDFRQSLMDSHSRDTTRRVPIKRPLAEEDISEDGPVYHRSERSNRSGTVIAAAMVGIVVLSGIGYYLWNHTSLNKVASSSEPRIILADKEPAKVVPEDKGGQSVPNQDKAVYDKVAGANTEDPKQKTLISSAEVPVDVVQKTLAPEVGSDAPVQPSATETADTQDNRLLPAAAQATPAAATSQVQQPTIAPRKVKTMILRSDGTLVQRDDGPASAPAVTPVSKPIETASTTPVVKSDPTPKAGSAGTNTNVAKVDNTQKSNPAPAQTATTPPVKLATPAVPLPPATNGGKNDTRLTPNGETKTANAANAGATTGTTDGSASSDTPVTVPAHKVKTTTTGKAPVPSTRPADQPVNVVGTVTENGKVVPADSSPKPVKQVSAPAAQQPIQVASVEPSVQPAVSGGGFGMQVASFPSEDEAKKAFPGLKSKYGGFLASQGLEIRKADIPGMGTRYRVRVPVGSKDEAAALCVKFRSAGGSCLVAK